MARLLFFGALRDAAGCAEMAFDVSAARTVADLRDALDPALAEQLHARGVRVALDQAFCDWDAPLEGAQEIAFMSPLSGG